MKKIYFVCITALLMLGSCAKEDKNAAAKQQGCMDNMATNFDANANEDCSCCKYSGRVVFYFGQEVSKRLQAKASNQLTFYVGGTDKPITAADKVGTYPSSKYWNGVPPCGIDGSITITRDLGSSKSKTFAYQVNDEVGNVIWKSTQEWKATTGSVCTIVELK